MRRTGLGDALARSAMLAVVTAALAALVSLLIGSVWFYAQARMGRADPRAGFEPNLFLRQVGLPLSAAVLLVTFAVAFWRLKKQ